MNLTTSFMKDEIIDFILDEPLVRQARSFEQDFNIRVWSWLRTNAGGVLNTCKSNGDSGRFIRNYLSGGRVSNTWVTCPMEGDNIQKWVLIPHKALPAHAGTVKDFIAIGWTRGPLASWWGNGSPRRRWVADLRGWTATLELRHGPDSYGRQQWGILHNGGNPDAATPREWRRPSGCKTLS